jgi:hypothetical protein
MRAPHEIKRPSSKPPKRLAGASPREWSERTDLSETREIGKGGAKEVKVGERQKGNKRETKERQERDKKWSETNEGRAMQTRA